MPRAPRKTSTALRCLALGLALSACKKVEPAPKALDDLTHYFWQQFPDGEDAQLAEGVRNLHKAVDGGSLDELLDGTLTDLSRDEAELVGVNRDPKSAQGLFLVNTFDCELSQLEEIVSYVHQDELYPDTYSSYEREFSSDRGDFLSGDSDTLTWSVHYEVDDLVDYSSDIKGGLRRVPTLDDEQSPYGDVLLARTYLPSPAKFDDPDKSLDQDYQMEVYYERSGGEILHLYAIWRQADFGGTFTTDNEGFQRLMLNNLADWDDVTEERCAEGRP
jgi:hypothetical protein